ncbi:hypothetical protein LX16_3293 [Stackebrandtia albiflava]|uniref:MftR C-terminal domain-containing protein n=1 Tax=Stackebrandtia albiflava TaxID=406432 RepID=A0A562V3S4_9ACTN|nr:hypothetical protein [Stackebrandtia albiflava]TWJ12534.1 hypothetical protein LX16_3293 [Stackebrandtia albiflava]
MSTERHVALVDDLRRLMRTRLLDPLEILLGEADTGDTTAVLEAALRIQCEAWAARLLDGTDAAARATAARLVSALYPGDDAFDPPREWWSTPLGRAVAARAGHPTAESVSYATAGAMLGITRQGVADLLTRGKLDRHPDGGVSAASVSARLSRPGTRPTGSTR